MFALPSPRCSLHHTAALRLRTRGRVCSKELNSESDSEGGYCTLCYDARDPRGAALRPGVVPNLLCSSQGQLQRSAAPGRSLRGGHCRPSVVMGTRRSAASTGAAEVNIASCVMHFGMPDAVQRLGIPFDRRTLASSFFAPSRAPGDRTAGYARFHLLWTPTTSAASTPCSPSTRSGRSTYHEFLLVGDFGGTGMPPGPTDSATILASCASAAHWG